ncbi:hypothetical protein HNY73_015647, partial [Argiope bruennichi]
EVVRSHFNHFNHTTDPAGQVSSSHIERQRSKVAQSLLQTEYYDTKAKQRRCGACGLCLSYGSALRASGRPLDSTP